MTTETAAAAAIAMNPTRTPQELDMKTILRKTLANMIGLASLACIVAAVVVQGTTPYGYALMDGGGRLTDLGCYLLVAGIMAGLAALLPFARWVDETGRWQGGPN